MLVPYFEGERTPNRPDATASLLGLTLASSTRANIARAHVEGMLCGLADGVDAVRSHGLDAKRVLLVGGAAFNPAVGTVRRAGLRASDRHPQAGRVRGDGCDGSGRMVPARASKPQWAVDMDTHLEPDSKPVVREQYRAATEQLYA